MKATLLNGETKKLNYDVKQKNNITYVKIKKDIDFSNIKSIDFIFENNLAIAGDDGYFVIPGSSYTESMLCYFNNKEDTEYVADLYTMPIFGVKTAEKSFVAIASGMAFDYSLVCGVKNGRYYIYPRFNIDGEQPYEDICVEYHYLECENSDYSGMAREYRNYQLMRGACKPIKTKILERKELDYAVKAPLIRIRMGWKPVPTPVAHQTLDNEPPMHTACTFKTAQKFIEKLHQSGVRKAEISLVGWNVKGHDGRWPSALPVESDLGGEKDLHELILRAKELGFQITCHTNSTDSYEISPLFDKANLRVLKDGKYNDTSVHWSGGNMFEVCPKCSYELAKKILPQVRNLGFNGLHYIDVISVLPPRKCYDKNHPVNTKDAIIYDNKIMELCHTLFGGFSSEGCVDFTSKYLDYVLYTTFGNAQPTISDKIIPLWHIVYHGIIMYNPSAQTINYTIKDDNTKLKMIEYGGRPAMYIYSRFVNEEPGKSGNWMGNVDLTFNSDEDIDYSVEAVKKAYLEYNKVAYLENEFIEYHKEISEKVYEIGYTDGSIIKVDYNNKNYELIKG